MELKFDRNLYLKSIFSSKQIYFESFLPIEGEEIKLLYRIKKVMALTDYGMDKVYKEGVDYEVVDGKLYIKKGGAIKKTALDDFYLKKPDKVISVPVDPSRAKKIFNEPRFFVFGETDGITKRQYAISYEHDDTWDGYRPIYQGNKLHKFFEKLSKKQPTNIVFFGDSITVGCNSSGTPYGGNTKPYAEPWPVMIHKFLEEKFQSKINYINTAVGGKNTEWGLNTFQKNVNKYKPDLLVLGFGMNDGNLEPSDHIKLIKGILNGVMESNPNIEVVLIATTVPNIESTWYNEQQAHHIDEYKLLNMPNVTVVNMTDMHKSLLTKKDFRDMTGNNVNHPNDFLARVYAQNILGTILEDYEF